MVFCCLGRANACTHLKDHLCVSLSALMLSFASQVMCLLHCESCGVGRLRGGVEIYGAGKQMVDVVMATLAAQIEW